MFCVNNNQIIFHGLKQTQRLKNQKLLFKGSGKTLNNIQMDKKTNKALTNCAMGVLLVCGLPVHMSCTNNIDEIKSYSSVSNIREHNENFANKAREIKSINCSIINNLFWGIRLTEYRNDKFSHTSPTYTKLCDIDYDNENILNYLANECTVANNRQKFKKAFTEKLSNPFSPSYDIPHESVYDEEYLNGVDKIFKTSKNDEELLKKLMDYRIEYSNETSYNCIIKLIDEFTPLSEAQKVTLEKIKNDDSSYEKKLKEIAFFKKSFHDNIEQ